jgi:hypothetical protein
MSRQKQSRRELTPKLPEALSLPEPIFLPGEDKGLYFRMLDRVMDAISPTDIIEALWVRDIVDLWWDAIRYRRLKASFLDFRASNNLEQSLSEAVGPAKAKQLARKVKARDAGAIKDVERILEETGSSIDAVVSQDLVDKLPSIAGIDAMAAGAESRRNSLLRELDRHRAAVAASPHRGTERVEDAQFTDAVDAEPDVS